MSSADGGRVLHSHQFPAPTPEPQRGHERHRRIGDRDRPEDARRAQTGSVGQHVRNRQLPQPEAEQVDDGRRHGIAGAVERLGQHHRVRVEGKPGADNPERVNGVAGGLVTNLGVLEVKSSSTEPSTPAGRRLRSFPLQDVAA